MISKTMIITTRCNFDCNRPISLVILSVNRVRLQRLQSYNQYSNLGKKSRYCVGCCRCLGTELQDEYKNQKIVTGVPTMRTVRAHFDNILDKMAGYNLFLSIVTFVTEPVDDINNDEELAKYRSVPNDNMDNANVQNMSLDDISDNRNDVYPSIASNSVAQLLEQPQNQDLEQSQDYENPLPSTDPSLTETTKFLNNLRKEYYCPFCKIMGIEFESISLEILETHALNRHPGCNILSQPFM